MKKFSFLVFVDDDHPSNVFHEIVLSESQLCENSQFFTSPLKALAFFEQLSLKENPEIPEILFLDINMPFMNGWEFLEKFQQLSFKILPKVIMLSSSNYPKDIEKAKNIPLVYTYMEKPLNEENLRILSQELLHDS